MTTLARTTAEVDALVPGKYGRWVNEMAARVAQLKRDGRRNEMLAKVGRIMFGRDAEGSELSVASDVFERPWAAGISSVTRDAVIALIVDATEPKSPETLATEAVAEGRASVLPAVNDHGVASGVTPAENKAIVEAIDAARFEVARKYARPRWDDKPWTQADYDLYAMCSDYGLAVAVRAGREAARKALRAVLDARPRATDPTPPEGGKGLYVAIGGLPYEVERLRDQDHPTLRLAGPRGQVYDVTTVGGRSECDCPDFRHRRAGLQSYSPCKHVKALASVNLVPSPVADRQRPCTCKADAALNARLNSLEPFEPSAEDREWAASYFEHRRRVRDGRKPTPRPRTEAEDESQGVSMPEYESQELRELSPAFGYDDTF